MNYRFFVFFVCFVLFSVHGWAPVGHLGMLLGMVLPKGLECSFASYLYIFWPNSWLSMASQC